MATFTAPSLKKYQDIFNAEKARVDDPSIGRVFGPGSSGYESMLKNIAYYSPGGAGYVDELRDFELRQASTKASELGITAQQLVENPELATDPAALLKYKTADTRVVEGKTLGAIASPEPVSTTQSYTTKSGDTLSAIAQRYGVSVADITGYRSGDPNKIAIGEVLSIKTKQPVAPPPTAPSAVPEASTLATGASGTKPSLPQTFANQTGSYLSGVSSEVDNLRKQLEDTYKKQIDDLTAKANSSQAKIDALTTKQENALVNVDALTQPFRQSLEASERTRLKIEENFFANQAAIDELKSLLNDYQGQIATAEGQTGLTSILSPRIAILKENLAARAGIIQAVMSARSKSIAEATSLIDRTKADIEADRKDRLTYYEGLLNFYQSEKDDEGNKLLSLTKDQKSFLEAQVNLVGDQLQQATKTADYVKQLLLEPSTANLVQQAGITLNDTIEQINFKLGNAVYQKEIIDQNNDLEKDGYQYLALPAQQTGKPEAELVRVVDSKGVERVYWRKEEPKTTTGATIGISDVKSTGLPPAVVGMSETEILRSLDSQAPPSWFSGWIQGMDTTRTISSQEAQGRWDEYRNEVKNNLSGSDFGGLNLGQPIQ